MTRYGTQINQIGTISESIQAYVLLFLELESFCLYARAEFSSPNPTAGVSWLRTAPERPSRSSLPISPWDSVLGKRDALVVKFGTKGQQPDQDWSTLPL